MLGRCDHPRAQTPGTAIRSFEHDRWLRQYGTDPYCTRDATVHFSPTGLSLPGQAGDHELVDEKPHRVAGGWLVDDPAEDEIPGHQVPEFVGDGGVGDLTAVDRLLQHVPHQRLALIDELVL